MEELDIPAALKLLEPYDLSPIERVLLGHTGTVQVLLSLWFNEEVVVIVTGQDETTSGITRDVNLVLKGSELVVAQAHSQIPVAANTHRIFMAVREKKLGLGQIAVKHHIPTTRLITELDANETSIRRRYSMEGLGLQYVITEEFPRALYDLDFTLRGEQNLATRAAS